MTAAAAAFTSYFRLSQLSATLRHCHLLIITPIDSRQPLSKATLSADHDIAAMPFS